MTKWCEGVGLKVVAMETSLVFGTNWDMSSGARLCVCLRGWNRTMAGKINKNQKVQQGFGSSNSKGKWDFFKLSVEAGWIRNANNLLSINEWSSCTAVRRNFLVRLQRVPALILELNELRQPGLSLSSVGEEVLGWGMKRGKTDRTRHPGERRSYCFVTLEWNEQGLAILRKVFITNLHLVVMSICQ